MEVKNVRLQNFRNYSGAEAEFHSGVNVITGDNAQGKTNLLEAVYMITGGRSFRTRSDGDIIKFGEDSARIQAQTVSLERDMKVTIDMTRGRRKAITVNGARLKTAAELAGRFSAVLFCPDDLGIVKDGAAARRRLMDTRLSQMRPRYAMILTEYGRALESKMRILKDFREKPALLSTLDDFNERLADLGSMMIKYRAAFVEKLDELAGETHMEFSGKSEKLELRYKTVSTVTDVHADRETVKTQLLSHVASHRRAELESGSCLSGVHRDDLEIFINGAPARSFASQGQTRTAALSVKLAERELHHIDSGEYPVLLLDDVLSELDPARQNFVLNKIKNGQVLITCCEDARISQRTDGRIITVKNGEIS